MCELCTPGNLIQHDLPVADLSPPTSKFAALRNRDCRPYLGGSMLSMMADNTEHVITYWVLWQRFHSPALVGFEIISHWLPFLLLSVCFGGLADRFDCRKVIQAAQGLFMVVSASWGFLFFTNRLAIWNACLLLVLHGMAGSLWAPAEQMLIHDFVGPAELPSAVRLNATARSLGVLLGPVVGSVLLLGLGPKVGILVNVSFYVPLTLYLARTKFTGHVRDGGVRQPRLTILGGIRVLATVRNDTVLLSMIVLAGLSSLFIGASLQSVMPQFSHLLGGGNAGTVYGILLFATGFGGVAGGILLEATGTIPSSPRSAVLSSAAYGATLLVFAATRSLVVATVMLLLAGVANLATTAITQTIVQLRAPADRRGAVVGVYSMSSGGLRTGSGLTVGLVGGWVGLQWSLGASAVALCIATAGVFVYLLQRRPVEPGDLRLTAR
jgi:MFS family permease